MSSLANTMRMPVATRNSFRDSADRAGGDVEGGDLRGLPLVDAANRARSRGAAAHHARIAQRALSVHGVVNFPPTTVDAMKAAPSTKRRDVPRRRRRAREEFEANVRFFIRSLQDFRLQRRRVLRQPRSDDCFAARPTHGNGGVKAQFLSTRGQRLPPSRGQQWFVQAGRALRRYGQSARCSEAVGPDPDRQRPRTTRPPRSRD